jgi:hypothetical protein
MDLKQGVTMWTGVNSYWALANNFMLISTTVSFFRRLLHAVSEMHTFHIFTKNFTHAHASTYTHLLFTLNRDLKVGYPRP